MSAEFPKNEPTPVETPADKIAKLRAEIAALEAAEAAAPAAEAQAEVPTAPVKEQPIETAATPDPAIAEQQAQQSAADTAALEATKERLGITPSGNTQAEVVAPVASEVAAKQENNPIDAVALNNKIVNMRSEQAQAEAIANLTPEEITAVADMVSARLTSADPFNSVYALLGNFKFKTELMEQPQVAEALKSLLVSSQHIYNVDRILKHLPDSSAGILEDPGVKKGLLESISRAANMSATDFKNEALPIIDRMGLSDGELHDVAEQIKGNGDQYSDLVKHFGVKRLYSDIR